MLGDGDKFRSVGVEELGELGEGDPLHRLSVLAQASCREQRGSTLERSRMGKALGQERAGTFKGLERMTVSGSRGW